MKKNIALKTSRSSMVTLSQLMDLSHANLSGNVHGGYIMKMADEAGALACMRHSGKKVVTVAIDSMTFHQPIKMGDLVVLNAEVTYSGRTSMEAEIRVVAEHPLTGVRTHTNTAYIVYVALDDKGRPTPVPPLTAETEDEKARFARAKKRQESRIARKSDCAQVVSTGKLKKW